MTNLLTRVSDAVASTPAHRWYAEKSHNDRRIVRLLVLLTVGLVFVAGIWIPVTEFQQRERARAIAVQSLFEWITLNRSDLTKASRRQNASADSTPSSGPTIAKITSSAAQFNIVLSRLQPEADGTVSVSVEQQSFDKLIRWLALLEQEQQYVVERGSVDRGSQPGVVSAQFRFR